MTEIDAEIQRALTALGSSTILGTQIPTLDIMPTDSDALNNDILSCGGLPRGRAVEIYAQSSVGKCLAEDTYIITDGGIVQMGDLATEEVPDETWIDQSIKVSTVDGTRASSRLYHQGYIRTLKITTDWLFELECGYDRHRVLCIENDGGVQYEYAHNLKVGDYVGISYGNELYGNRTSLGSYVLDADLGYFIGALIGDGYVKERRFSIICHENDRFIVDEINRIMQEKFELELNYHRPSRTPHLIYGYKQDPQLKEFFSYLPELVRRSHFKEVPSAILRAPKEVQIGFLQGLFDTDGSANKRDSKVTVSMVNKLLTQQVRLMLLNMGIVSNVRHEKTVWNGAERYRNKVIILSSMANRFAEIVGFRLRRKQDRLEANLRLNPVSCVFDRLPFQYNHLKRLVEPSKANQLPYGLSKFRKRKSISKKKLSQLLDYYKEDGDQEVWAQLRTLCDMQVAWFEVTNIEEHRAECWDLEVPSNHNFISNGFISHNSTFCQWLAGQVQKREWTLKFPDKTTVKRKGAVCWFDAERSLMSGYAKGSGMVLERVVLPQFGLGNDMLTKLKMAMALDVFDLIVVDSIQAVIPDSVSDIQGPRNMRDKLQASVMWSQFFQEVQGGYMIRDADGKLIKSKSVEYVFEDGAEKPKPTLHRLGSKKCCLIFINHARTKIETGFGAGRGPKTYTPGGVSKDFAYSIRIEMKHRANKMGQYQGEKILRYKEVEFKSSKNKLGVPLRSHVFLLGVDGTLLLDDHELEDVKPDLEAAANEEEGDSIDVLKKTLASIRNRNTDDSAEGKENTEDEDKE